MKCRAFLIASHVALLAKVMGMAEAAGAVSKREGMRVSESGEAGFCLLPTRVWPCPEAGG